MDEVLELEALMAGVAAKQRLWAALMAECREHELGGIDLRRLSGRAEDQLSRLRSMHELAAAALGDASPL